mgnify:CR=1 FL=1
MTIGLKISMGILPQINKNIKIGKNTISKSMRRGYHLFMGCLDDLETIILTSSIVISCRIESILNDEEI